MIRRIWGFVLVLVGVVRPAVTFTTMPMPHPQVGRWVYHRAWAAPSESTKGSPTDDDDSDEMVVRSKIRIDDNDNHDGGSDLTDRFKYKVNALMGVFDPPMAALDNEREYGNIIHAMLKFPTRYAFAVVGKTEGNDDLRDEFVNAVKELIRAETSGKEDGITCVITPRGTKFTKVTIEARVDSAAVIRTIYAGLEKLERSVMQF